MERIFVDSSAWVALFGENDQNHKKAVSIFENLKKIRSVLHTSDYVFDETITTLLHRRGHKQAVIAGEILLSSGIVSIAHIADDILKLTWSLFKKYDDKRFSFTDVSSFVLSKELGIRKAFTFDADFKKAGMETVGI